MYLYRTHYRRQVHPAFLHHDTFVPPRHEPDCHQLAKEPNMTKDIESVTCKKCLASIQRRLEFAVQNRKKNSFF